jgi:hypothetical protein
VSLPSSDPGDALGRFRLGPAVDRVLSWPDVSDNAVDLADDDPETFAEMCARAVPAFVVDDFPEQELLAHVEVLLRGQRSD